MTLNPVTDALISRLKSILPAATFRDPDPHYFEEPRGRVTGQAGVVLAPGSTDEVAAIVRLCAETRTGIVPLGGGTGLVLGQVMETGPAPVLLSLERMTRIRAVYPEENVLVAEAGAVLANVQQAALDAERLFPLSLGAEGSCRIGGNLSTNAGGLNVLRYGNTRDLCLGLEAVLPDGSVWNGLRRLRKDNTGYDLRNLLIGAEGTLGIITAASLRLYPRPARRAAAMMQVSDPAAALSLLSMARGLCGETVSIFELISGVGLDFVARHCPDTRLPLTERPDWAVMIDLGTGADQDPEALLSDLFEQGYEAGLVQDGVVSQSEAQRYGIWEVREMIPVANKRVGSVSSHDISLPLGAVAEFIPHGIKLLQQVDDLRVNCFGHLGDGNLHYNVFPAAGRTRADYADKIAEVQRVVHDLVAQYDGSFSAEHGVGRLKVADLERYGDPARLAAMRAIKSALDPQGIMNPGAVLRAQD